MRRLTMYVARSEIPMTNITAPIGRSLNWRIPIVMVLSGCLISVLTFGSRSSLGLFLTPLSQANGWGRDVFSLAIAIQNLLWGVGQPFVGAIADKFGAPRVLSAGAALYALGLYLTATAGEPGALYLSAGVLIGFGLSGCAVPAVIGALSKLLPTSWGAVAFGAVTAAGSFGQFLFSPLAVHFQNSFGWQNALVIFSSLLLLVIPLSLMLSAPRQPVGAASAALPSQSFKQALSEAFGHRSYNLLVLGFFTCGFQLAFVTVHLPPYLVDRGLPASVGAWTVAVTGLLWLSTVPPTSGLVALMFGTRWLAMLFGFAFFSHQVGGFLGVWLGGLAFEYTHSYNSVWWLSVLFGVLSAVINLPIVEKPVARAALAPA